MAKKNKLNFTKLITEGYLNAEDKFYLFQIQQFASLERAQARIKTTIKSVYTHITGTLWLGTEPTNNR